MERYAEAVQLFEDGLPHLEKSRGNSPVENLEGGVNLKELRASYEEMYAACLTAARAALAIFPESK